ncbi:MAG: hypothetical protein Q8O95_05910 [bacterium]|nr:hypothetical protein [bacterium]
MTAITQIKEMLESAEASLKNAKKMLLELSGEEFAAAPRRSSSLSMSSMSSEGKVIEGVFNGERMIAPDGENFPVPANYASKSKLVAGDHLKLTILNDGRFVYKQIGPVPRKTLIGTLVHEDGQYRVLADGRNFRVLLASVTYYKAEVGNNVTIIVPEADDTDWAAIEAVLPGDVKQMNVMDDQPDEEEEVDF